MSLLLQELCLAPVDGKPILTGLVSVADDSLPPESTAEAVARREALLLKKEKEECGIDYIFFRRFNDGRSSQISAYVVDNSKTAYSKESIAELHRRVWLHGAAPLLYVEWPTQVDVLRCATKPDFWNKKAENCEYSPAESICAASSISELLDKKKTKRFSAFRLSTGTFWEDPENKNWARADRAAHKLLLQATIEADTCLREQSTEEIRPVMRRLLLLFIFAKYLEDRGVFPKDWFSQFNEGATSFIEVLKSADPRAVEKMLQALKAKFNGDIFTLENFGGSLTSNVLSEFVFLLEARTLNRQRFLWEQYSFRYIPVSVLSHLYQHFAQEGHGAIYTPSFVADLILDHALPYNRIRGDEKVLDPTCGSGVFLVGAFRRLVHHWQSKNNWSRPGVPLLKDILKKSIFGVEYLPEAANVAALNLALAVCDALQPKVIWNHLKFDTLLGKNLLVGDFFENLNTLNEAAPKGFSCIVGNPPFRSKLTPAAKSTRDSELTSINIPDQNIAFRVLEESTHLLGDDGNMCLLQPSGLLYNSKARRFTQRYLSLHSIDAVLDFVSIRNLFEAADTKAVALLVRREEPKKNHSIHHLTFRRTKSVHERLGFELDHYDLHAIPLNFAIDCPWVWKVNLLGGGRLINLTKKTLEWPSLKSFLSSKGWDHGEGFTVGNKKNAAEWLTGMPYIHVESISNGRLNHENITSVLETEFEASREKERYDSPMVVIVENESLNSAFIESGSYAFRNSIISINAPEHEKEDLKIFHEQFLERKDRLLVYAMLQGSRALIGKSTSILKRDIEYLPWWENETSGKLSWWEDILLADLPNIYAPLIRTGHNSYSLKNSVSEPNFQDYSNTFISLLGTVYHNLRADRFGKYDGLAFQSFTFGESSELNWPENWAEHLNKTIFTQNGAALRTHRIIRFYEKNTLIIVKPDRLRNWIPSTAIRDADETLEDLREQGF